MFRLISRIVVLLKGDVTRDDSQRRFLAQHSIATLLRHCFEYLQHYSNIATLCCAKNRRCESSRVTSLLRHVCLISEYISLSWAELLKAWLALSIG